jgi:tRNA(Ile)-lysidine synthase
VPHAVLHATVARGSSLQAQARAVRYAALTEWAVASDATILLTAHHADDQAETLLMRLARGAGLSGLSGVRASLDLTPGVRVARPLLNWRKVELQAIVDASGHVAASDPTNQDPRHDRTAVRALLAESPALDAARLTASAHHLAQAEDALDWMTQRLAAERLSASGEELHLDARDLPEELARRLLLSGIAQLGGPEARGPDVARALATLRDGGTCTLSGLQLSGGAMWTLRPAPPRRRT